MIEEDDRSEELNEDEITQMIEELCKSKAEEFQLLGYLHINPREIWDCISEPYAATLPPLHRIVNDVLSLKITKFMNWATRRAYRGELDNGSN